MSFLTENPAYQATLGIVALLAAAYISNLIVRKIVLRTLGHLVALTDLGQDRDLKQHNFVSRLAHAVPAMVVLYGVDMVPALPASIVKVIHNVSTAFIILTLVLAASTVLDAVNAVYTRKGLAAYRPIKGYLTVTKIALGIVSFIFCLAVMIDRSPVILLSGLGAMAAVLILVFQDTLLSFVASIQISSSQMIRVGDWVESPKLEVDGIVSDIALYHITVRNRDLTLTTIPIRKFIGEPFKNWRGMQESGARRIKRAIHVDQAAFAFATKDTLKTLTADPITKAFATGRTLAPGETNAGLFRAYLEWYLAASPAVDKGREVVVKTLAPESSAIPLELMCFVTETEGTAFERIQSGIFDHALSVMSKFGLTVKQGG